MAKTAHNRYVYHEPRSTPCDCGLPHSRHRVRHPRGCHCPCSHKGGRSPSDSRAKPRYFVGLDGEGAGRKPHQYTLLAYSSSDGKKSAHRANHVSGLKTKECLDFILSIPPEARAIGFFLHYDWTMMLRDLPNVSIFRLFRPALRRKPKEEGGGFTYVRWKGYRLHYLAGMMHVARGNKSTTVWDVGKFYQTAFVKALDAWEVGTDAERELIRDMKVKRSEFSAETAGKVLEYCLSECRLLATLGERLKQAHDDAGLKLRTWHGPGSTASALLRKMSIQSKRGEIPPEVQNAARRAFFGGRFEHSIIGTIEGPIYGADIVSAYPAQCVNLPCLEHGRWEHVTSEHELENAAQACIHFTLERTSNARAWGPLPIRLKDGTIVYPRSGASGWTWIEEYQAARRWDQVRFIEAWTLRTECDCVPFAKVQELFDERNRVGRKTGVGLTIKLAINSVYGKLAQSVGVPPFRSQAWAGMVTSGTRAQLLGPIERYDDAILAVATDGIYSTARLDLDYGDSLGQWERSEYPRIMLVRPGIYWSDETVRSRGLPRKSIADACETIQRAMAQGEPLVKLEPVQQFGGARACVYRTPAGLIRRASRYGEWFARPVRVSFDSRPKRPPGWGLWDLPGVDSEPYRASVESPDAKRLRVSDDMREANR